MNILTFCVLHDVFYEQWKHSEPLYSTLYSLMLFIDSQHVFKNVHIIPLSCLYICSIFVFECLFKNCSSIMPFQQIDGLIHGK